MSGFFDRRDPFLAGVTAAALLGGFPSVVTADALGLYAWENRPLFVYAPAENSPGLAAQRAALEPHLEAMRERDMVWVEVIGDLVTARLGNAPDMSAEDLRDIHAVSAGEVRTVLVGKDTGVKLRSEKAVGPGDLFGLIDGMPMRQSEMRRLNQEAWRDE